MNTERRDWKRCVNFHGHECPGLMVGYRASRGAQERLGFTFSPDEEVVCITENDACGVDAVQVITGCTFGKGNLLYRATGKQAFSFFNRKTGEKLRMVFKMALDRSKDRRDLQEAIRNAPLDDLFDFKKPLFEVPEQARFFSTLVCERCGEGAPEHKMRLSEGKRVCLDCFQDYSRGW
jgi:formylmethanofuran dehydrogenase subunit E